MSSADVKTFSSEVRPRPIDIATATYIFVEIILLLIFFAGRQGWQFLLFFYVAALGVVALMVVLNLEAAGPFWRIIRVIYPLLLFTLFYEAVGPQVFMIFRHPFDSYIVGFERMVFGADPAFAVQPYIEVWLNELMSFGYASYYLMLPVVVVILLVRKRYRSLERMVLAGAVTFYVCYLMFILFPVVGPRFHLDDFYYLPLIGPFFTPLTQRILAAGGLLGGAMPSSHCAVALVVLWTLAGEVRKAAFPAMLMLALLCAGTVYGRCHYVSDVVAGLLLGAAIIRITGFWQSDFLAGQRESVGEVLSAALVSGQEQPAALNTRKNSF